MQYVIPDAALIGNSFSVSTVALAEDTIVPPNVQVLYVSGFDTIGDGGAAFYERSVTEPVVDGKFQSLGGVWWEIKSSITAVLNSLAVGEGVYIPLNVVSVTTNGYYLAGDGGGGTYKRSVTEPTHSGKFQSSDGAWWELLTLTPNVRQFGAKGDGTFDDTSAFLGGITYAQDRRLELFVPSAVIGYYYKVTQTLLITKPMSLTGENIFASYIRGVGVTDVLKIDGTINPTLANVHISNLCFDGNSTATNIINISTLTDYSIVNVGVGLGSYGIHHTASVNNFAGYFEKVISLGGLANTVRYTNCQGGGPHTYNQCYFNGSLDGVVFDNDSIGNAYSFASCNWEQCGGVAIYVGGSISGLNFVGCRFEKNDGAYCINLAGSAGKKILGASISGCFFDTNGDQDWAIALSGGGGVCEGVSATANYFNAFAVGIFFFNGGGDYSQLVANYIDHTGIVLYNTLRPNVLISANGSLAGPYINTYPV